LFFISFSLQSLNKTASIAAITEALEQDSFSVAELRIPHLQHFLYKSKSIVQFTCPKLEAPYNTRQEKKRLFRLYQRLFRSAQRFKKYHKVYYQVSEFETSIVWITAGFELYAVFSSLESKQNCIKACNDILNWIKNEESSLFILDSPIW
jgi:hypothetical protein